MAREWPGPFRKSGSPKVMWRAPPSRTWVRISSSTISRGTTKKRPPYTGVIGTMAAGMQTSSAGFYITGLYHPPVIHEMGIMLGRRQRLSSRLSKGSAASTPALPSLSRVRTPGTEERAHWDSFKRVASATSASSNSPPMIESAWCGAGNRRSAKHRARRSRCARPD